MKRRPMWVADLFLEYLIAGIAEAIGILLVTSIGKYLRKKWKQWKKRRSQS